jgi:hypothetical protein
VEVSFKQFLLEAIENYDLKAKYDFFNKELFDDQLPQTTEFDLRWSKKTTGNSGGSCTAVFNRVTNFIKVKEIELSALWRHAAVAENEIDGILVHEMIHSWQFLSTPVNEIHLHRGNGGHSSKFLNKRKELQDKVKFDIPVSETLSPEFMARVNDAVGASRSDKSFDVLLSHGRKSGVPWFIIYKGGALDNLQSKLQAKYSSYKDERMTVYRVTSPKGLLVKVPVAKLVQPYSYKDKRYRANDEVIDQLVDAKEVYHVFDDKEENK